MFTRQGAEKIAGLDAPRVVDHAANLDILADHATAGDFRQPAQAEGHHAATPSASRTLTWSSQGSR